jgi:hypothetical protein
MRLIFTTPSKRKVRLSSQQVRALKEGAALGREVAPEIRSMLESDEPLTEVRGVVLAIRNRASAAQKVAEGLSQSMLLSGRGEFLYDAVTQQGEKLVALGEEIKNLAGRLKR